MNASVTENFVLLGIGLLVIALRLYARVSAVGITKLQADDYLMVAAAVRPSIPLFRRLPRGYVLSFALRC